MRKMCHTYVAPTEGAYLLLLQDSVTSMDHTCESMHFTNDEQCVSSVYAESLDGNRRTTVLLPYSILSSIYCMQRTVMCFR